MPRDWLHPLIKKNRKKDSLHYTVAIKHFRRIRRWLNIWVNRVLRPECWRRKRSIWNRITNVCLRRWNLCTLLLMKRWTVWTWRIKVSIWLPEMRKILLCSYFPILLLSYRNWKMKRTWHRKSSWRRKMNCLPITLLNRNVYIPSISCWKHIPCLKRTMNMLSLTDRWRLWMNKPAVSWKAAVIPTDFIRQLKQKRMWRWKLLRRHLLPLLYRIISVCITSCPVWPVRQRRKRESSGISISWMWW